MSLQLRLLGSIESTNIWLLIGNMGIHSGCRVLSAAARNRELAVVVARAGPVHTCDVRASYRCLSCDRCWIQTHLVVHQGRQKGPGLASGCACSCVWVSGVKSVTVADGCYHSFMAMDASDRVRWG